MLFNNLSQEKRSNMTYQKGVPQLLVNKSAIFLYGGKLGDSNVNCGYEW